MPRATASSQPPLNWELLRRVARRILSARGQAFFTASGLLVPLGLTLITILRPFNPRQMSRDLEQLAIWLAAFYVLFTALYVLAQWLAPQLSASPGARREKQAAEERGELPLPVSGLQLFIHRAMELGLVPLRVLLLGLPLWLAACLYIQLPYGEQWLAEEINYPWYGDPRRALWIAKLCWLGLSFIAAMLLPLAWALLLQESLRSRALRCVLLVLPAIGVYAVQRFFEEHLRAPYQQTRGYDPFSFLAPIVLLVAGALVIGLLRPRLRVALLVLAGLLYSGLALAPTFSDLPLRYAGRRCDAPNSARYLLLHLSPPRNARLILHSWTSNVVVQDVKLLREPEYPQSSTQPLYDQMEQLNSQGLGEADPQVQELQRQAALLDAAYNLELDAYWKAQESYEQQFMTLPRLPMLVGAGALPLLLPLLLIGGLALGAGRERRA